MTTQLINNEGEATMTLCGRLDTAVSSQVSADINQLLATAGTIQHLTVDAGQLEYISSSGLRILLMLAKRFKQFRLSSLLRRSTRTSCPLTYRNSRPQHPRPSSQAMSIWQ